MSSDHFTAPDTKFASHSVKVLDSNIHYLEAGEGDPILFLHGVPTSSHVWRNIIPHLSPLGRCLAPDLIGFGESDKPDIAYTIHDHIKYITAFIDVLNLKNITIVMHGWGSIIGSEFAINHQDICRGLVFYESFLRTMTGDDVSLPFEEQLIRFEEQDGMADPMSAGTSFVDFMMPQIIMQQLDDNDIATYRKPFSEHGTAKPLIQYFKELPRGDGKSEIDKLIADYTARLCKSRIPKLLLYSVPGFITTISTVMWAKDNLPNIEVIDIGEEFHLGQEVYPELIGESISAWLQNIEQHNR